MNFLHILRKFNFIFFTLSLTVHSGFALSNPHFQELGQSYTSIYHPGPFKYAQNFNSIVQNKEGFLFIGTDRGILRFDGTRWHLIQNAASTTVTGKSGGFCLFY